MTTRLLLASDFDGTLAPIQRDPTMVEIEPQARAFFEWASKREGVTVAFVSGRDLDDLRERTAELNAWRSGSHGQEIESADGRLVRSASPRSSEPPGGWEHRAIAAGLRLERKKFGIALHWRGLENVDDDHPLVGEFEQWARSQKLETTRGRCVVEAAVPGASKRAVLETLIEETGAERVVYAGDDVTDLTAIELAAERGRGFFIRSSERDVPLNPNVESVGSTEELLVRMKDEILALG
jgi:trehalose-phosphatase